MFISGNVTPGTILAIFPGKVHLPEYTTKKNYIDTLLPDEHFFLMKRYEYRDISQECNRIQ